MVLESAGRGILASSTSLSVTTSEIHPTSIRKDAQGIEQRPVSVSDQIAVVGCLPGLAGRVEPGDGRYMGGLLNRSKSSRTDAANRPAHQDQAELAQFRASRRIAKTGGYSISRLHLSGMTSPLNGSFHML